MQKLKKEVKGITLIALVVTIIVLLILAGVAIGLSIGNNGLFTRAENATNTWRKAEANEQAEMSNFESLYDETVKNLGLDGSNDTIKKDIDKIDGTEIKNIETTDKNGERVVVVPAGFKVVNPEATVDEGIVIEDVKGNNADTVGNQFVWIPCTLDGANNTLKYDRYAFTRETPAWDYNQSFILGENGEYEKDVDESYKIKVSYNDYYHEAMTEKERVSIEKYGGYYIGRYEVGCDSERSSDNEGDITAVAKIKSALNVYNYVMIDEAATIAERMYSGKSRLCSSYAWDTALQFIGGIYAVNSEDDNCGTENLEDTGYHAEKNIYDMGGNVAEWTTEACGDTAVPSVSRRWLFRCYSS